MSQIVDHYEIIPFVKYFYKSKKSNPVTMYDEFSLYVHRVQNVWNILHWLYTHRVYYEIGVMLSEFCFKLLFSNVSDDSEYKHIIRGIGNFKDHNSVKNFFHKLLENNDENHLPKSFVSNQSQSALQTTIISNPTNRKFIVNHTSSFFNSNTPQNHTHLDIHHILRLFALYKKAEEKMNEVLSNDQEETESENQKTNPMQIFVSIFKKIKRMANALPEMYLQKSHDKFSEYMFNLNGSFENVKGIQTKCKEIYHNSEWFQVSLLEFEAEYNLFVEGNNGAKPSKQQLKKWLERLYNKNLSWLRRIEIMILDYGPEILEDLSHLKF